MAPMDKSKEAQKTDGEKAALKEQRLKNLKKGKAEKAAKKAALKALRLKNLEKARAEKKAAEAAD